MGILLLTYSQSFASSKQYLCCICSNNPRLHHSLFATTGNADCRTFALYYVVFTILIQFLCYKHLDHIPQMKRLLMSIQRLSKKSESSFAEALWLAWTFVADKVGITLKITFVSISSGGHAEICNNAWACS
nr:putative ion channel sym8 [Quercus suber]